MSAVSTGWGWLLGIAFAFSGNCALAQITPDGTLPNNSNVTLQGNTFNITGGTQAGSNLFHSFGQFSVPTRGTAFFNNAVDIQNIISRVTGGSISNINGLIHANGTANLFLINPSGIVFGRNASLNVGGSFVASTANAIQFGNQGFFSASNPNNPALLTVNPSALFFNQIAALNPNISTSATNLSVRDGQGLFLVGGNINIDSGELNAFGGRLELGGLAEVGTVGLNLSGNNLSLSFPDAVARGDVSVSNGASVSVASGGGGSIAVNARNIDVLGGSTLRAGISPLAGTTDNAQAGDVNLNAKTGTLRIENSSVYNAAFDLGNAGNLRVDTGKLIIQDGVLATATLSSGRAGNLMVNASDSVVLTGSPTSNSTVAINIPVVITRILFGIPFNRTVNFPVNVPIGLFSASIDARSLPNVSPLFSNFLPTGGGDAGNLTVNTGRLTVSNGAVVSAGTTTTGRAGNLSVNARDFIELSGTSLNDAPPGLFTIGGRVPSGLRNETAGRGLGGNLTINTRRLTVRDGAWVTTGTGGRMPGGELTVNASESVDLSGISEANNLPSVLSSGTQGAGNAKPLTINTQRLSVRDGAIISAGTSGLGQGGNLTINASDSVELIGTSRLGLSADLLNQLIGVAGTAVFGIVENSPYPSGIITGSAGNGNAGTLSINTGRLLIKDGAQASVSTVGPGNAGSLNVRADSVELTGTSQQSRNPNDIVGRSLLTTAVGENSIGRGGDIRVETDSLTISDGAALTASTSGQGNAGNIFIPEANLVSVSSNGLISTAVNAQAQGQGGNIDINTNTLSVNQGGQITASTLGEGNAGTVTIDARDAVSIDGVGTNGFSSGVFTSTGSQANGSGGAIAFQTGSFKLTNGAVVNAQTSNSQKGGNVTIEANTFEGNNGGQVITTTRSSGNAGSINITTRDTIKLVHGNISTNVDSGANGNAGSINIKTGSLSLTDGAVLNSNTSGRGSAGDVTVKTRDAVSLADARILTTVEAGGVGNGGNIDINAATLSLIDGAQLLTLTRKASDTQPAGQGNAGNVNVKVTGAVDIAGQKNGFSSGISSLVETGTVGNGGNITIDSGSFSLRDGARLNASTFGQGNAGTIKVNAADFFTISSSNSNVDTGLFVNSQSPTGTAGDIIVTSPRVTLDNRGRLNAESASGNGGNMNLQSNLLVLRRGGQISTTAGTAEAGGNGGNINIDAGFIVAVPKENSDITANAFSGNGGTVRINAKGIFGIQPRQQPTPESDITASSTGGGINGVVNINTLNIDPSRGFIKLPTNVVNTSTLVAQSCSAFGKGGSEFTVTGRGGLPLSPDDFLSSDVVWSDTRLTALPVEPNSRVTPSVRKTTDGVAIIPATGWVFDEKKGEVTLIAANTSSEGVGSNQVKCIVP